MMEVSYKFIIAFAFLMHSIQVAFAQTNTVNEYYEKAYSLTTQNTKYSSFTHWTQETEELRRKWNKTKEEIDSIKQNVIIIK